MGKKDIQDIVLFAGTVCTISMIATSAFAPWIRKEIFRRDKGVCQCGCGRSFDSGFMVQAAHFPDLHQYQQDRNPNNGRILSTECHLKEEISRNNIKGARLLYESQTFRSFDWIIENGGMIIKDPTLDKISEISLAQIPFDLLKDNGKISYLIVGDEKPPFESFLST